MTDPFGLAIHDSYRNEQDEPLIERHGDEVHEHSQLEQVYFDDFNPSREDDKWIASWLDGPLLDIGAGTGRHTLYFQDLFETVAIEVSTDLVAVMEKREVEDARHVDMFDIRGEFERDRFQSSLIIGTQLGLTGSIHGLRDFLSDLAFVTTPNATAVIDSYDPEKVADADIPGFRSDPTPGATYRIQQFEYGGHMSEPLLFRFFSPDKLEEAVVGTHWKVNTVRPHPSNQENPVQYRVALEKR